VTATTYTFTGLQCGTSYSLGVAAYDQATNVSERTPLTASTSACPDVVVTAAGDIATTPTNSAATAALIEQINPTRALALGDNAYENGDISEFLSFYDPNWGRFKANTSPVPGNHEYQTPGATGYFRCFGARAPAAYYSFDLGAWHLIALNGEIGVGAGSAQEQWLRDDLAAHPDRCILAYWHEPRFSSGAEHGSDPRFDTLWRDLYAARVDVVLNGHEHVYERFAPQNPAGEPDANGIRQFTVGTGGASHYSFLSPLRMSQVRDNTSFGVLKMTLHPTGYDWEFVPVAGASFRDAGSGLCQPPPDTTAPSAPTGLTASASVGAVSLDWTASTDDTGVAGYDVYRDNVLLAQTGLTTFVDSSVSAGATYTYTVKARDTVGNISAASNTATATVPSGTGGAAPTSGAADWAGGASGALTIPASAGTTADSTARLILSITDSSTTVNVPVPSPGNWGTPLQVNVADEITYVWAREVQAGDGGATVSWTGGSGTLKGTVGVIHNTGGLDQAIAGAAHNTLDSVARSTPTRTPNGPNRLAIGIHTSDASPNPNGSAWTISGSVPSGWAKLHESVTSLTGPGGTRFILPFVQAVTLPTATPASAGAAPIGASGTQESSQIIAMFAPRP
jgi:chitodextrinase